MLVYIIPQIKSESRGGLKSNLVCTERVDRCFLHRNMGSLWSRSRSQ